MEDSDDEYVAPQSRPGTVDVESDVVSAGSEDGMARRTRATATPSAPPGGRSGAISDLKSANGGYAWEDEYQRSWDVVKDDDRDGGRSLDAIIQTMIDNRKKKIMKNSSTPFQRGIIRTVVVVIDGSSTMSEKDLRPTRFGMMLALLADFVVEFFDQNPISQMGIVMMRNGVAYLVSEVNGSPQTHLEKIRQLRARQHNRYEPKGDPSLQNALEMSRSLLKVSFGQNNRNSKEILVILGALFTSDPGDIHKTINSLVKDEIKVRVIGLSAQVAICQELVNRTNHTQTVKTVAPAGTGGNYGIIMNEAHFRELLLDCVVPLPVAETESLASTEGTESKGVPLIKMGFPSKIRPTPVTMGLPQLFASSVEDSEDRTEGASNNLSGSGVGGVGGNSGGSNAAAANGIALGSQNGAPAATGYQCPQCSNKVAHLPTVCPICGLMLILSTHLARSYHHLVPLIDFKEVPVAESYPSTCCYGCLLRFPEGCKGKKAGSLELLTSSRYRCKKCQSDFCIDCDVFIHETLHNCPGCENIKYRQA
ncbi:general transcription and DNA repair factor IIH subunit Ssl1p [[Candida] anglica]|uniref:General transcription and DNA repair factor IIH n=1 Tax=[Candida] anglica TaxID=148631 RepID=A0ABP0ECJ9_9ASCO